MAKPRIVGLTGHFNLPSRTATFCEYLVREAAARLDGVATVYSVMDLPEVGRTFSREACHPETEKALADMEGADLLVAVTPVYKGTYAGLFKHVIDLLKQDALEGHPVIIGATGYSERHAAVIDHAMGPLFAFFRAEVITPGLFVGTGDISKDDFFSKTLAADIEIALGKSVAAASRRR